MNQIILENLNSNILDKLKTLAHSHKNSELRIQNAE